MGPSSITYTIRHADRLQIPSVRARMPTTAPSLIGSLGQQISTQPSWNICQRRSARYHKLLQRFLALSPKADPYYRALEHRRLNPRHHVTKIVALSEIYGTAAVGRAIEDALEFDAVSSEYIANLLESRARALPEPGALHLTRRSDLLELDLPEPDLDLYDNDE